MCKSFGYATGSNAANKETMKRIRLLQQLRKLPSMNDEQNTAYLRSLQPGELVIETTQSSCMFGKRGVVYISDNEGITKGSLCAMWEGGMGTSVTHGTRRVVDIEAAAVISN